MPYEGFPIETDPTALAEEAFAWLQSRPGWETWVPRSANFDAGGIEGHARIAAEVRDVAATHADEIFVRLGELSGIPRRLPAAARVAATLTAVDTQGYTLPAGAVFGIRATGDTLVRFLTLSDTTIPPGATTVGGVQLVAEDEGAAANDLGGDGVVIGTVDRTLPWATVTLTASTSGGADEQTVADYLDAVAEELQLSAPRPILPRDFAAFARRIPGVYRAVAVDLYVPNPPYGPGEAANVARALTVYVVDEAGEDPGPDVRAAVQLDLAARRESTFLVYVAAPTYLPVAVSYSGAVVPGYDPAEVRNRADVTLMDYLSPGTFGIPAGSGPSAWSRADRIRRTELYAVLNQVPGIDYVEDTLTINGAATDLTLSGGAVVLPTPLLPTGILL